jgi:hypothetical protein
MRFAAVASPLLVLGVAACETPVEPSGPLSEPRPSYELVDLSQRLDARLVNAHVYGSFAIPFDVGPAPILSGPANFPGNPPHGPGTCDNGLWIKGKGKRTAGTLQNPHPHCTTPATSMTIVLEPISALAKDPQKCPATGVCEVLDFGGFKAEDLSVTHGGTIKKGEDGGTVGEGTIFAYAIDASTLAGANHRVGYLEFSLDQFDEPGLNLFDCSLDEEFGNPCLNEVINARYYPLEAGGVGTESDVSGFLWWAAATAPYNY